MFGNISNFSLTKKIAALLRYWFILITRNARCLLDSILRTTAELTHADKNLHNIAIGDHSVSSAL
jgi:hypothetical protein